MNSWLALKKHWKWFIHKGQIVEGDINDSSDENFDPYSEETDADTDTEVGTESGEEADDALPAHEPQQHVSDTYMGEEVNYFSWNPMSEHPMWGFSPFSITPEKTTASDTSLAFHVSWTLFVVFIVVVRPVKTHFCIFTFSIACLWLNIISPVSSVTLVVIECNVEHFWAAKEHLVHIFLMGAKVLKIGKNWTRFSPPRWFVNYLIFLFKYTLLYIASTH